jgi:transposase
MPRPLSLDLRKRVAAALKDGETVLAAAKRVSICASNAVRIGQWMRAGKSLGHIKMGGGRASVLEGGSRGNIDALLAQKCDWTVRDLSAALKAQDVDVSHDTVWRFLHKQGLSFKKR